jgi:ATP-dependent DNA helicase PIF1
MTIHKWSGLGDGRFSGGKLKILLQHDDAYANAKQNILKTDLLIVDEISMFSAQMLDNLEVACSIRSQNAPFGGIQVIFVGDFTQLPPVRHLRYGDVGAFSFESKHWPEHSIFLTQNMRQRESRLCEVVNALSIGRLDNEIIGYLKYLSRPIPNTPETVKLFSNNLLVDMHNREKIMNHRGELFCFDAIDEGSQCELTKLIAPKQLWLKVGIPVMLLRNLTEKLVNGLIGKVLKISQEIVHVHFPRCDIVAELSRVAFTGNV